MARKTTKKSTRKAQVESVSPDVEEEDEEDAVEETTPKRRGRAAAGFQGVLDTAKDVRPNIQAFCDWIEEQGGPKIRPSHAQIVLSGYKHYQTSDAAKQRRAGEAEAKEQSKAERDAAREQRRAAAAARKAERAEKASKPAKAASKKAAPKKATAASKPAKAAKKVTKKGKGVKAPY